MPRVAEAGEIVDSKTEAGHAPSLPVVSASSAGIARSNSDVLTAKSLKQHV
jgi:hypothetical protein